MSAESIIVEGLAALHVDLDETTRQTSPTTNTQVSGQSAAEVNNKTTEILSFLDSGHTIGHNAEKEEGTMAEQDLKIVTAPECATAAPTIAASVVEAIHSFIQDERKCNFFFLGRHSHYWMNQPDLLFASPATADEITIARKNDRDSKLATYADRDWFTFKETGPHSLIRTIVITTPVGQEITKDSMAVPFIEPNGTLSIMPVAGWIRETYHWDQDWELQFKNMQYEELTVWWERNGKVFKFLHLPLELREAIYLQCIGSVVLPDLTNSQIDINRGWSFRDKERSGRNRDPDIEPPNMTIMGVSKQVRAEASVVVFRDTTKRFLLVGESGVSSAITAPKVLLPKVMPAITESNFLQYIQLSMSAKCYFAFVGMDPRIDDPMYQVKPELDPRFRLGSIKKAVFPSLKKLDFHFISPKHPDAVCPWALASDTHKDGQHSCQKTWVNWLFTLGWDEIKALSTAEHPVKFSLSGCVKNTQRAYWERTLNDMTEKHTPTMRWIAYTIRQEKRDCDVLECECSSPCSKAGSNMHPKCSEWSQNDLRNINGLQELVDDIYWSFEN